VFENNHPIATRGVLRRDASVPTCPSVPEESPRPNFVSVPGAGSYKPICTCRYAHKYTYTRKHDLSPQQGPYTRARPSYGKPLDFNAEKSLSRLLRPSWPVRPFLPARPLATAPRREPRACALQDTCACRA
jgi:hypothetical protein